jgi:hypothetical protein
MVKLSIRATYWIACLVGPTVFAALSILVLFTTRYGDNLPLSVKIGAPIFLWGLTAWWALATFKKAKDRPKKS